MISSTLLLIILGGTYAVVEMSMRTSVVRANDMLLEQNALIAMARVSQEVVETDAASWRVYANPPGIVFASPRDANGVCQFDGASSNVTWQAWVCYYVDTVNGSPALVRKDEILAGAPLKVPPAVDATRDTLWFKNLNRPRKVIALNVTDLSSTALPSSRTVDVSVTATHVAGVSVRTAGAVADSYRVQNRFYLRN